MRTARTGAEGRSTTLPSGFNGISSPNVLPLGRTSGRTVGHDVTGNVRKSRPDIDRLAIDRLVEREQDIIARLAGETVRT